MFESEGRGLSWPHLLHTANSSQVKVWLDDLLPRANHSRFALELQAVSGALPLSRVDVHRSIDDEYTPSVFKVSRSRNKNRRVLVTQSVQTEKKSKLMV